jgi:predicted dehydrogenase
MKVAVAGLGWWGKQIIRCLDKSPKFEVLYGVDPRPPADIPAFAKEFKVRIESDLAAVLRDPAVEGVILATPHLLHEEQVLAVVAAGRNVFCEKPLTMTGAGAQRIVDACAKAGKVLGIGHERRWEPAFEELNRMIGAGVLGKILHMDANVSHNLFRNLDATNWRLDPAHAPAGMMTATGIHLTDLFVCWAGPAAEVRARTDRLVFQPPAEDFVNVDILFKAGVRGSITLLSCTPYYGRFTVYGDRGWVEVVAEANVDQGKPTQFLYSDGPNRKHRSFDATDTVTQNFESWADAVDGRGHYRYTPGQLVDNVALFEGIVQSSRQGGATIKL